MFQYKLFRLRAKLGSSKHGFANINYSHSVIDVLSVPLLSSRCCGAPGEENYKYSLIRKVVSCHLAPDQADGCWVGEDYRPARLAAGTAKLNVFGSFSDGLTTCTPYSLIYGAAGSWRRIWDTVGFKLTGLWSVIDAITFRKRLM